MWSIVAGKISNLAIGLQDFMFIGMVGLVLFLIIWTIRTVLQLWRRRCTNPAADISEKDNLSEMVQKVFYQSWVGEGGRRPEIKKKNISFENTASALSNSRDMEVEIESEKIRESFKSAVQPPKAFLNDAVFQYGMSVFEDKMLGPYEALVNLFPPIGFLGTIIGMTMLFIDQDGSIKDGLSSAGMGTALLSTIFALVAYVFFESVKMLLQHFAQNNIRRSIAMAQQRCAEEGKENAA